MPFELAFTCAVTVVDRADDINECCVGGDIVAEQLLPSVRDRYGADIAPVQEDWGWFLWFNDGKIRLAIDIHTDDPEKGQFRIHLTSSVKRLFRHVAADTPELDELRDIVVGVLTPWTGAAVRVTPLDDNYSGAAGEE